MPATARSLFYFFAIFATAFCPRSGYADGAGFSFQDKPGESLDVLRDGKRIKMPLKTYRMSFRK